MIAKYISIIVCLTFFLGTVPDAAASGSISFSLPDSSLLSNEELAGYLSDLNPSRFKEGYEIEIVVYLFSPGVEIFSYSEKGEIEFRFEKGVVKALLKLKRSGELRKVKFISAEGSNRSEILENFVLELMKII